MKNKMLLSGAVALLIPIVLQLTFHKRSKAYSILRIALLLLYTIGMLYFTVFREAVSDVGQINLTPFWSYMVFRSADVRWQVYMNVFLFIPFGFLLPWAVKKSFLQTFLIGLIFSSSIEVVQYFFRLGLCEFDDVFHNTLGTVIGYGYWMLLARFDQRFGNMIRNETNKLILSSKVSTIRAYHYSRAIICNRLKRK